VGLSKIDHVRVSGGGANSELWRQILADVLDVELATVNTTEGAAFGAALLAGVGVGAWPNVETACVETISVTGKVTPDDSRARLYKQLYAEYQRLYPALKSSFHKLGMIGTQSEL